MNSELLANNYIIIPNFISKERAKNLANEFELYSHENNIKGDVRAPNSNSKYNWIGALELLCEMTPSISNYAKTRVLPTYAYTCTYRTGDDLKKHSDRDSCEISVTLHLEGDCDWPIHIQRPDKSIASIILQPGDAMIYLGCIADHWRDSLPGSRYSQIFLHYVESRGSRYINYFDTPNENHFRDKQQHEYPVVHFDHTFVDYSNVPENLKDYIVIIDNILSEDLCNLIIEEYQSDDWLLALVGQGVVNKNVRNVKTVRLDDLNILHKNLSVRNQIITQLNGAMFFAINKYKRSYAPGLTATRNSGFELLQYSEECFYKEHVDSFSNLHRHIAVSFHLNDDYEGGEFGFYNGRHKVKAKKGSVVIFPSNFMYPHEIFPVTKGKRYSIITWII